MNKQQYKLIFLVIIIIFGYLSVQTCFASANLKRHIAIVVSKKIKPYMNVAEGITKGLNNESITAQFIFLDSNPLQNQKTAVKLENTLFDLFVAVGPEAVKLVWNLSTKTPVIFTAVLDPDSLQYNMPDNISQCGISLRIPVKSQIREISKQLVNLEKIGLLFDDGNNREFYEKASLAAQQYKVEIVPLKVSSRSQITEVLTKNWENIDCVWMIPDRTIISEKVIQHIIKLGIYHGKAVIGYNSFFIRSGAVFSFDFDYNNLGLQTALKIIKFFKTGECTKESPEFKTLVNRKILDKISFAKRRQKK